MNTTNQLLFNEDLLHRIQANLRRLKLRVQDGEGLRKAAVAITVVEASHDSGVYGIPFHESQRRHAAIVLTRRSLKLKNHAGQWALPGGRMEKGESPEKTALRELSEEVGLELPPERVIGRLDDFPTRSRFRIAPVVVWGGSGVDLTPNPSEVESIHRIPVAEFMRKDAPLLDEIPGAKHPVLRMPVGDSWIAAPTAALLYQFREVAILGKDTRVSHYEQPFFAWK